MENIEQLNNSVQSLYSIFSKYSANREMSHCSHCVAQKDIEALFHSKLDELTLEELDKYILKAMTTWGDVDDFKHFLPRILELIVISNDEFQNVWLVGSKLNYGNFINWISSEYDAVTCFFESLWSSKLSRLSSDYNIYSREYFCIDDYLQCFSYAYKEIQKFLDIWHHNASAPAMRQLVRFLIYNIEPLTSKKILWDDPRNETMSQQQQIITFLLDDMTRNQMESAFFKYSDTTFACEFSEGLKKIDWIRTVFSN